MMLQKLQKMTISPTTERVKITPGPHVGKELPPSNSGRYITTATQPRRSRSFKSVLEELDAPLTMSGNDAEFEVIWARVMRTPSDSAELFPTPPRRLTSTDASTDQRPDEATHYAVRLTVPTAAPDTSTAVNPPEDTSSRLPAVPAGQPTLKRTAIRAPPFADRHSVCEKQNRLDAPPHLRKA